mgnify:CR=1 FL=1
MIRRNSRSTTSGVESLSVIESESIARMDALLPKERIEKSMAMFHWMREMIGRQLVLEVADAGGAKMSDEELKWRTALRIYGSEAAIVAMIERKLQDISS